MNSTVVLHVMPQFECFSTKFTFKGSVASVYRQMCYQRGNIRKTLATKFAQHYISRLYGTDIQIYG